MVVLGERVGVTRGGQASPARVGGVDRPPGFSSGVGWRCGLAAECGGEQRDQATSGAHERPQKWGRMTTVGEAGIGCKWVGKVSSRTSCTCWLVSGWGKGQAHRRVDAQRGLGIRL